MPDRIQDSGFRIQGVGTFVRAPVCLLLLFSLLLGVVYPLAVTALAQLAFHRAANGSLIEKEGRVVGSELLGQHFSEAKYFWGRLSATTPPYNAAASSGSNLSPANPQLQEAANVRLSVLRKNGLKNKTPVPADLVSASASGLDPHISIASARFQVPRVAQARRMKEEEVLRLVEEYSSEPFLGFLGEPRVNVLLLNLALDKRMTDDR